MSRPTRIQIDREALAQNLRLLKAWTGDGRFFCPMVKANAYGHGDILVAQVVEREGASAVGVALVEEALQLRQAGIRLPILCFSPLSADSARVAHENQITPVAGRFEDLHALRAATSARIELHLKFNTGMNRLGFSLTEIEKLKAYLLEHPQFHVLGICTHLTHGDEIGDAQGFSARQLRELNEIGAQFPGVRHGHKSATLATLARRGLKNTSEIGSRPGISIYGLAHDPGENGPGLKPVLTWKTELVRVHQVKVGEAVSYGARWLAKRPSRIGVVPVGYGDGYRRMLSNCGEMLLRGMRVPVVGSVCMDYTLLDLTDIKVDGFAQPGEEVVLIGRQGPEEISAEELAQKTSSITYEVVTALGARVAREAK